MTPVESTAATAAVVWFRDDLRVRDNPALRAALAHGPTVAVYVLDEESPGIRPLGGAARWWLHYALKDLAVSLEHLGVPLVLRRGTAAAIVPDVAAQCRAGYVAWNRRYGGPERRADTAVKSLVRRSGREAESFQASLLHEPWDVLTQQGGSYKVFTPFWREVSGRDHRHPLPEPERQRTLPERVPISNDLEEWELLPRDPDWSGPLAEAWTPGEQPGHALLGEFVGPDRADTALAEYPETRDHPARPGTSRLSPYLRWGHLSPFQVWHAVADRRRAAPEGSAVFASELGWREFAWHTLFHHADLASVNLRSQFDAYPWWLPRASNGAAQHGPHDAAHGRAPEGTPAVVGGEADARRLLEAWQRGRTGFPLVDAGQRELWATGWMHNRVRMVSASLLVKNLGIHWRLGERWFWDTLVDADAASNPFNWQWVAGSGADAAPFFRIFNPRAQAKNFDPDGTYARDWIPELGTDEYPQECVDLAETRVAALEAYQSLAQVDGRRRA
ncbi:deoxyribodipyrimidine photo-lyase [Sinomonas sp. ASV486]|uniref:cryptochrome/photolyase family protein n=1 Tax=Sinomonas sp. ASV486 TaxID=3051170 RepID=UPI0027DB2081|nr:deoxyribodipyrimidine photo-lyase [Sinomonas sp. ASV486]MDQ4491254.1 deoxyribodipyrimidine photo-lyase [Sinomonas sp. ASV486]